MDFLQLSSLLLNLGDEALVVRLHFLIVVSLLRIQVVQFALVSVLDLLNLLLVRVDIILHFPLLSEKLVKCDPLLIILVLNVHEEGFDVVGLCVGAMLVEGQVIVGQLAFESTHILDQGLVLAFEVEVGRVVLVYVFDFLLHF